MNKILKKYIKTIILSHMMTYRLSSDLEKCLLFTFDDGPSPQYTPEILRILDEWNCKAIFFIVGNRAINNMEIIKLIVDRGHIVGNHTYNHNMNKLNYSQYKKEILDCQKIIYDATGKQPRHIRFPGGHLSISGISAAMSLKLKMMMWSSEGGEWYHRAELDSIQISKSLLDEIKPRDVIMLHDDNDKIPQVLERVLPALSESGFDLHSAIEHI